MADISTEMIEANPERYQVLANGAIYDHEVKRIVSAPPPERQHFTQENASAIARERWLQYTERFETGAGLAVRGTSHDAWERIATAQTSLALDTDRGRASTEAAKFVRSGLGLDDNGQNDGPAGGLTVTFQASEGLARALIDSLRGASHDK